MKITLVLVFALIALSLPVSAATATPEETSIQALATDGVRFLNLGIKPMPITPLCDDVEGQTCFGNGTTKVCKDWCGYQYTCTCHVGWPGGPLVWSCPPTC
jgi:hypothetical protein